MILKLKNAVMFYLLKNREQRKVPKLKDIISQAIAKQKQQNEEKRKRREKLSLTTGPEDKQMTEANQKQLKEASDKVKALINDNDYSIRVLKQKIIDKLLRKKKIVAE
jgi:hypothetical protein